MNELLTPEPPRGEPPKWLLVILFPLVWFAAYFILQAFPRAF